MGYLGYTLMVSFPPAPARASQRLTPSRSTECPACGMRAGWRKWSVDLEGQTEYLTPGVPCLILVCQPSHCRTTALDKQMEGRAKTRGLPEPHCLGALHLPLLPFPLEPAGVVPRHLLHTQFPGTQQGRQRGQTLGTETQWAFPQEPRTRTP